MDYPMLAGLGEEDRRAVLSASRRRRFAKGDTLFHEGDLGDVFFLLAKGRVGVRVATPDGDVATLAVLGPGTGFGEQALLTESSRRTATVVALEAVEALALGRATFLELRAEHAGVTEVLVDQLALQVRRLSEQLAEALFVSADRRVLRRVLDLDELYAGAVVPLTQDEVASMAGTTRSTANRVLQGAVDAGLVELGRGRVRVLDRDGLARRAR